MKAIINGKRYNTETANLVASWSNGYYVSDFHHCAEDLYVTRKGAWFLSGEGGPMSKYSVQVSNGRGGGGCISAISAEQARSWLEERQEVEALEKYFASDVDDA